MCCVVVREPFDVSGWGVGLARVCEEVGEGKRRDTRRVLRAELVREALVDVCLCILVAAAHSL